jgi:hypothetical protein
LSSADASSIAVRARSRAAEFSRSIDVRPWREAAVVLVVTRLLFLGVAYGAAWYLATGQGGLDQSWVDVWSRWDALHFYSVATEGYSGPRAGPHATAFFPGFPLLLRGGIAVGLAPALAGLLVSTAASLVAFGFLFKLAEHDGGAGAGRAAVTYLAVWPTAVFLVAPYSEALFLAGAIPSFYFARTRRWGLAGAFAAVAVATRFAGVFLLLGLALEFVRQGDFARARLRRAGLGALVAVTPMAAYGAFLARVKGDPLYFFTDQRLGWGRTLTNPVRSLINTWTTWDAAAYPSNWIFAWRIEVFAAAVGVGLFLWTVARREWGYAGFVGATMAALVTSTWYFSIPRMLLSLFPAMVLLAGWTHGHARRHELLVLTSTPLATLGVIVFTSGAWFY